ncbi:helix-turn-helix domain-containing protein [Streptomyces sp. NPDC059070]|uniref:nSTAND1 domain-containing NTPase n=1 Tax=Streptomyces sp. NPDC059070 TaxID=3346713 RepID=UPI003685C7BC
MVARPEKPLDPGAGPVAEFAEGLRRLRRDARLSYRELADKTGYSPSTLSQAAGGEKLPSLAVALAYVEACGTGADLDAWEARWHLAERAVRRETAAARTDAEPDAPTPYRGLTRYEPGDSALFFGRGALTDQLVALVARERVSVVVGPSGSGKSSLLRAGLLPRLQRPGPTGEPGFAALRICTPGPRPATEHEKLFTPAASLRPADGVAQDTLLVIDQFEEVFTLCQDADGRDAFLGRILDARSPGSRLRVVLGVRADFYTHCLQHPGLATVLRDAHLPVGPMAPDELREAITKPPAAHGVIVERPLTTRLIKDVSAEPGALPLMSHALLETWHHRTARTLSLHAYEAAGGLDGAVARTAETLYTGLDDAQALLARRVLLRLITPGDGTPDTRRPVTRDEIGADGPGDTTTVLDHLARARLITLDDDRIDLAHEALITAWPRLAGWIEEDRDRLRAHRQLTDAAQSWREQDRDRGVLLRGGRLETLGKTFAAGDGTAELTGLEREFLTASRTAATRERRLKHAATVSLAVLVVLALVAAVLAWGQRQDAEAAQRQAQSRQLAAQSQTLLATDADLASLLAVAAYRASPTAEASTALYAAAALPLQRRLVPDASEGKATTVAFAPDGRTVAVGTARGVLRLWDTATGRSRSLARTAGAVGALAFSPDGRSLAVGAKGSVRVWDTVTGRAEAQFAFTDLPDGPDGLAYDRDGRTLTISLGHGTIRRWEPSTGRARTVLVGALDLPAVSGDPNAAAPDGYDATVRLKDPADGQERTIAVGTHISRPPAVSPDGDTVALGHDDGAVRLRNVRTGRTEATLKQDSGRVELLRFSPDGRTVVTGYASGPVRLWNRDNGDVRTLTDSTGTYDAVFSPDGTTLATGTSDGLPGQGGVTVRDAATGSITATLAGYSGRPGALTAAPDGHAVASVDSEGTVRLVDVTRSRRTRTLYTAGTTKIGALALSPDGRSLAVGDATARVWDTATGRPRATLPDRARMGELQELAFTPDSRALAATGALDTRLWEPASDHVLTGRSDAPDGVVGTALSPDGRTRATIAARTGAVTLWDIASGRVRATLPRSENRSAVLSFSPDGRTVATADGTALRLWDSTTGQLRTTLTPPHPADTASRPSGLATRDELCGGVRTMAFSPDGRTLASSDGRRVLVWDVATGRVRTAYTGPCDTLGAQRLGFTHLVFSPDGRTLAAPYGNQVRLWDVTAGRDLATLTGHSGTVQDIAFAPDGRTLATAGSDRTVRLWDTAGHHALATLTGHTGAVTKVLYSRDGGSLFTVGDDGTLRQWGLSLTDPAAAVRKICAASGRELTTLEQSTYFPGQHPRSLCPTTYGASGASTATPAD